MAAYQPPYEQIFQLASTGYLVLQRSAPGTFVVRALNRAAYHSGLWGNLSAEEIVGRNIKDLLDCAKDGAILAIYDQVLDRGEAANLCSTEYPSPRGKSTIYTIDLHPLTSDQLLISFVDVTEQRQAEDALRKNRDALQQRVEQSTEQLQQEIQTRLHSEARLRAFCDALPDAGFIIDEDGLYVEVWTRADRPPHRPLKGRRMDEVLRPEDAELFLQTVRQTLASGKSQQLEHCLQLKNGCRWYEGRTSLISEPIAARRAVVWISYDITERKRAEAAVRQHAETLERQNAELDQFVYSASHDLQEPVRTLVSYSDLLKKDLGDQLTDPVRQDLNFIASAARRMDRLVEDLLLLSRYGRDTLRQEPVPLRGCVDEALQGLSQNIASSGAKIDVPPLPELVGDPGLLTQVYQNLILNALKYTEASAPLIRLSAEEGAGAWTLGVRDNGIGLDPLYADQVFMPFKRLHGMDQYGGNGIGLAICRKVIERHGGHIWVESQPGRGAHFKFTLPKTSGPFPRD